MKCRKFQTERMIFLSTGVAMFAVLTDGMIHAESPCDTGKVVDTISIGSIEYGIVKSRYQECINLGNQQSALIPISCSKRRNITL